VLTNTIINNNITNAPYAFYVDQSNRSRIFHNNIFNPHNPLLTGENSSEICFDNEYEGNYWSDYREKYPDASEINQSGIWDTSYRLSLDFKDNCPLVNP
jgi:nitrous oxidase accessory protein NosD